MIQPDLRILGLHDMPVINDGKKDHIDLAGIHCILKSHKPCIAYLEKAQAMPRQGCVSMFRYGQCYGIIYDALYANSVSFVEISPKTWKKDLGLSKDKKISVLKAEQLFPEFKPTLSRHHGQAEALLIAYWGLMKNNLQTWEKKHES